MRPLRWQPTRLPRPWDSPGKNTGVGCHFLLPMHESEVTQSCPTPCDPVDCNLPGSSIQARVLDFPGKSPGVGCHCLLKSRWVCILEEELLFCQMRTQERGASQQGALSRNQIIQLLGLRPFSLQNCEKRNICCFRHPQYGILLWSLS